ncbi:MAG: DUF167 family protein [Bauldia sp.]
MPSFYDERPDGVSLTVWVTPKARQNAVDGVRDIGEGRTALVVKVTAAPEKGSANEAVEQLVADLLGIAPRAVRVTSGHTARLKRLSITGERTALSSILARFN